MEISQFNSFRIQVPANNEAFAVGLAHAKIEPSDMNCFLVQITGRDKSCIDLTPRNKEDETVCTMRMDKSVALQLAEALTKLAERMP